MKSIKDIRDLFLQKYEAEDFVIDKSSSKTIEILGESYIVDEDVIFGTLNEDYAKKELQWYLSESLNVYDIPKTPQIWRQVCDSNGYINSNYGHCVFSKENGEQYKHCLRTLRKDKDSRRAMMHYTRPSMQWEYNKNGMSDYMCFTGETIVLSPEGDIPIKEVIDKINEYGKYPVYSVNFKTEEREIKWATHGKMTGKKQILRVHFDNGNYVDTTENHKFFIKTREHDGKQYRYIYNNEIEAKNLKPGMSCVTSLIYKNGQKHLRFKKPLRGEYNYKNSNVVHREYYNFINPDIDISLLDIHHLDENSRNNSISNLLHLSPSEHSSLHVQGDKNPVFKIKNRKNQINKMINTLKNTTSNRTIEWYEYRNNLKIDDVITDFNNFTNDRKDNKYKISKRAYKEYCKKRNMSNYYTSLINYLKITNIKLETLYTQNCKISKIEYLDKFEEVYDITVEDNHNFFVGWKDEYDIYNGVLVHNCTNHVQVLIRNNKLNYILSQRSCDAWAGFRNDIYWAKFVHNKLLEDLKEDYPELELGTLVHQVGSLHFYERQFYLLENYLKTGELNISKADFDKKQWK